tara:strand:+ start:380 stop:565 length:186 start_codon:yes stop_codon:yes gene_type:complete
MLEFTKKILSKVSFDKDLFKKELNKSTKWMSKNELLQLKIWSLITFSQYKKIIIDVFDRVS